MLLLKMATMISICELQAQQRVQHGHRIGFRRRILSERRSKGKRRQIRIKLTKWLLSLYYSDFICIYRTYILGCYEA